MKYFPPLASVIIIGLSGGAFYLFNSASEHKTTACEASTTIPVRVAQVRQMFLPSEVRLSGELLPVKQAELVSRLAGRVTEVRFKVGDFVPAGAVIATIRSSDLDYRLSALEADLRAAKQDLAPKEISLAESENRLTQSRELFRRDLIARREVEQSESTVETIRAQAELARAHIAQRQAMLAQARALQRLTRLSFPFSGEVGTVSIKPGAAIAEGGTVLSIVSLDTLKLAAKVNDAILLRRGMKAQISTSDRPGIVSEGHVVRFDPGKDSQGKNEAEIHVNNSKRILRPGMAVEASIDLEAQEEFLLIPRSAVFSENKSNYVYKFSAGQAVRQPVVLGSARGDEIAVTQGLNAEDAIIVDLKMIQPGTRVRPVSAPANRAGKE